MQFIDILNYFVITFCELLCNSFTASSDFFKQSDIDVIVTLFEHLIAKDKSVCQQHKNV